MLPLVIAKIKRVIRRNQAFTALSYYADRRHRRIQTAFTLCTADDLISLAGGSPEFILLTAGVAGERKD